MKRSPTPRRLALAAIPALALSACSQMGPASKAGPSGVAQGASLQQCETLAASFRHDQTSLESAAVQAAVSNLPACTALISSGPMTVRY